MTVNPYLLQVRVELQVEQRTRKRKEKYFTAKLVKRLLISADRSFEHVFAPTRGAKPKLVHVTPLYTEENGRIKTATYTMQLMNNSYHFYLGAIEDELDIYKAMATLEAIPEQVEFSGTIYRITRIEIDTVDVYTAARAALRTARSQKRFKLVFASPTIFRDPLTSLKHKTLVPSTMNIFSTPVYIKLYLSGQLRQATLMKTLLRLHRAITIPPTFWQTLRKKDLYYEPHRRVPTLIGYVNLHYNPENDQAETALDILNEILPIMLSLGTGVGRAAGLGHITTTLNSC